MNASQRLQIFSLLSREITEPKTELKYRSHFQLLIAVILSAQATDISVNRATRPLFRDAPNPETIRDLGVEGLTPYIRAIGLFNTKAKNIISTCNILIEKYQSRVPRTRAALEGLPGVGRKTANVILNTAFGEPAIAVDTHIFRISNRTGACARKNSVSGGEATSKNHAGEFSHRCAPSINPSRTIHVQSARTSLSKLRHQKVM